MQAAPPQHLRITAIDALRGAVMLLLLPDISGGFAFYRMAQAHPDSAVWHTLAALFTHADWVGITVWDMVMPVFVLLVGASIPLSYASRVAHGDAPARIVLHAVIRSITLVVLGLVLTAEVRGRADVVMPYVLLLGIGLPFSRWWATLLRIDSTTARLVVDLLWAIVVLSVPLAWLASRPERLGEYHLAHIFVLLGLAYLPAFACVRLSSRTQAAVALAVLAAYGAAFASYVPPPGLTPRGEAFSGWWSHWNNATNLGAAVDRWLFAGLPGAQPFADEPHGYHVLQFVPLIATLLIGMICARSMQQAGAQRRHLAGRLAWAGLGLIGAGALLAATVTPLVKSLWTPAWALFSSGLAVVLLALFYRLCDGAQQPWRMRPLVVLGTNSILMYTLAAHDRWRIVAFWPHELVASSSFGPVAESLLVLLTLWALAWALQRAGVLLRL